MCRQERSASRLFCQMKFRRAMPGDASKAWLRVWVGCMCVNLVEFASHIQANSLRTNHVNIGVSGHSSSGKKRVQGTLGDALYVLLVQPSF